MSVNIAQAIPLADTWGMHGDVGWGWMIGMMALMVLFWGGLIVGIVWLIRGTVDGRPGKRKETPLEVLEHRFAEGAISVDDYYARRDVLTNGTAGARAEAPPKVPDAAGSS
ncbi:MAG TPA: hypothetical protein VFU26_02210 [Gaiellaceae bacterium]|nr:hypothetical protein [Gaiellaceae bacterium]